MGECGECCEPREASIRQVPAVGGFQVLQAGHARAVSQGCIAQLLVPLPTAPQLVALLSAPRRWLSYLGTSYLF